MCRRTATGHLKTCCQNMSFLNSCCWLLAPQNPTSSEPSSGLDMLCDPFRYRHTNKHLPNAMLYPESIAVQSSFVTLMMYP
jgi:hypothetical protein